MSDFDYSVGKKLNFVFEGIERAGEKHIDQYLNLETYSLLKKDKLEEFAT